MSDVREQLADYAHTAWSGWMRYLFEKAQFNEDGTVTLPKWAVERWDRQASTDYADLPEEEKESDRAEADKMLAIVAPPADYLAAELAYEKAREAVIGYARSIATHGLGRGGRTTLTALLARLDAAKANHPGGTTEVPA
jgi:hypothetical protein